MRVALRQSFAPIVASGSTVILGVLCLLFSELNSNRGLGPVAAIGIACSLLVALTFLPAGLVLLGRVAFWPFRPAYGSPHPETTGVWGRVARLVGRRARRVWIVTAVGPARVRSICTHPRRGRAVRDRAVPPAGGVGRGSGRAVAALLRRRREPRRGHRRTRTRPTRCSRSSMAPTASTLPPLVTESGQPGQGPPKVVDGQVQIDAVLGADPNSDEAIATVSELAGRTLDDISGADALVGGTTAINLDVRESSQRDNTVIIPIVLVGDLRRPGTPAACAARTGAADRYRGPVLRGHARGGVTGVRLRLRLAGSDPFGAAVRVRVPRRSRHRLQHLLDDADPRGVIPS